MFIIAKTELTKQLEKQIYVATKRQGVFGCFEVTIGWFGNERVDYITYDTKGIWRCYEIKVSKSDFYSKAKKTFVGNFNYYVMPKELFEEVKGDVPSHVGVYIGNYSVKKAKKQELQVDEQILKDSLIRSLSRETEKLYNSESENFADMMRRRLNYERKEKERYRSQYQQLLRDVNDKFGNRWSHDSI